LAARARERWPQIIELHMRHRGVFTYVQASTEAGTVQLCGLRYVGSAHDWQVAIYRASHDDYAESIFPNGLPFGTEVVSIFVEVEVAVPHLRPAVR
jgi:hypothetical protein